MSRPFNSREYDGPKYPPIDSRNALNKEETTVSSQDYNRLIKAFPEEPFPLIGQKSEL